MMALVVCCLLLLGGGESRPVAKDIAEVAGLKVPGANWNTDAVLVGDVNGDGVEDYVIMGSAKGKVVVAVVIGPRSRRSRVEVLSFGIGDHAQSSSCEKPTDFGLQSADFDPVKDSGAEEPWEGFVRSSTAKVIEIGGDGCDPFVLYWNHKANELNWYRH